MSEGIWKVILREKRKKKNNHTCTLKSWASQHWNITGSLLSKSTKNWKLWKWTRGNHRTGKGKKSHNWWQCKFQEQSMLVNYGLINITSAYSLFGVTVLKQWFSGLPGVSSSTTGIREKEGWPFQCLHWKNAGVWLFTLKWGYWKA